MNVGELIAQLSRYPDHAPVEVFVADGTYQQIIEVDNNEDDHPDIHPLVVYLCAEEPTDAQ